MSQYKKYNCTVTEIFEYHANNFSDKIAVVYDNIEYTYKILNEKANQLAYLLKKKGVQANDFIGILLEPSADFIITMMAVVKTGAAYLPLDILAPDKRIADILEDANPILIITDKKYQYKICKSKIKNYLINNICLQSINNNKDNPKLEGSAISPLYLIYTSGFTGKPKGVLVPHQAIINVTRVENTLEVTPKDSFSQFNNLAFDGSTFEVWSALLNGAKLVIIPINIRNDYKKLKKEFEKNNVNVSFFPTSYFQQIAKSYPETFNSIRRLMFGGEQFNKNIVKDFINFRRKNNFPICLINAYGPTETTAYVCRKVITEQNVNLSSMGTAIKHVKLYVLDEKLNQVEEGELYVSGINLALGYHKSNLNISKFLNNPFNAKKNFQKIYKTGDIVRKLPNGELLWLERIDDQVKIGGFRLHLKEIEEQLIQYSKISMASVGVEISSASHKILVAYLVPVSKKTILHPEKITCFLTKKFPAYMIPKKYIQIDEMPLTLSGKVDKNKLSQIIQNELTYHRDTVSDNIIENKIKDIWKNLLNIKTIDPYINLFDLGANSLLLTEACSVINKNLNSELQISDIFSHPTIHKLSLYLQGNIERINKQKKSAASPYNIAIVGMSCRFPQANSLEEFWKNLCDGIECLDTFEKDYLQSLHNNPKVFDDNFVPVKGIIPNADMFDAHFFGFSPYDAKITDPQHRIFLECVWEAFEHAGFVPNKNPDRKVSVFAGMADSTYLSKNNILTKESDYFQERIATSIGMLSTQTSYRLNLKGRSLNINTACSTGLVTVNYACQDLILNNCDVAVAGAIHISFPIESGYHYQKNSILSEDGHCRPFSKDANGTVFSDGSGVVILKRLEDAIRDKDTIYAVIKSCGINNDGSEKLGFTAPSIHGQMTCIQAALNQAALEPEDIHYIETHGTATALGDAIEIEALTSVYKEYTNKKQFCLIGSCKANIGHTDVAAGMAGLIKTTLCLYHKKIPPLINFGESNPNIQLEKTPFYVNQELINWSSVKEKNACVSSFGFGGTNVHMVISEYVEPSVVDEFFNEPKNQLAIISAKTRQALEENIKNLAVFRQSIRNSIDFSHLIYTLRDGREDFRWRTFGVGRDLTEIIINIKETDLKICDENTPHNIIFMFPGQGTQYYDMARELIKNCSIFDEIVTQGYLHAKKYINIDLAEIINNPNDARLYQTQFAQPALFIIEYALAKTLMELGIQPNSLIGHSLGEYVAACIAGVFSFENGIALICERAFLMQTTAPGGMLAVECEKEDVFNLLKISSVEIALHNTQEDYIFSGSIENIKILKEYLFKNKYSYQNIKTEHAFHSQLMESIKFSFKKIFSNIAFHVPTIPIISNLTGKWLSAQEIMSEEYWYSQMRKSVKFYDGIKLLLQEKNSIFIEIGPGNILGSFVKKISNKITLIRDVIHTLPSHHEKTNDYHNFLTAIGKIWQSGVEVNWGKLDPKNYQKHIAIPTYAFQKKRYYINKDNKELHFNELRKYKPVWSRQENYKKLVMPNQLSLNKTKYNFIIFKDIIGISDKIIFILKKNNINHITIDFGKNYKKKDMNFIMDFSRKEHYFQFMREIKEIVIKPIFIHLASCSNFGYEVSKKTEIDKQLMRSFYSLLYTTQAYNDIFGSDVHGKFVVITNNTQMILGSEKINPINATLIGASRVIMQEYKNIKIKLIDIDLEDKIYKNEFLLSYIIYCSIENEWYKMFINAFRNNYIWYLVYVPINQGQRKSRLKDNGVYLFTGGLGGIALSLCEAIAKEVKHPKFILFSRRSLPNKHEWESILKNVNHKYYTKIHRLKKLEKLGAQYYLYKIDITDFTALKIFIKRAISRFKKIDGLIHGAGISNSQLIQMISKFSAESVFSPKLLGTYNLIKAIKNIHLDFVILQSSLSAVLGGVGQVDYSAANCCLDSFASSDLFSFTSYVACINWNTWQEIGMAVDAQKDGKINFLDQGNSISIEEGQKIFLSVLKDDESNIVISKTDLNQAEIHTITQDVSPISARDNLVVARKYDLPNHEIESKLLEIWQNSLEISSIKIDDDFFSLGGHSLKALGLIETINTFFQTNLPMTQIYATPTIKKLTTVISEKSSIYKLSPIIQLKSAGQNPPYLFLFHPISGLINCFDSLVKSNSLHMSIYGLQDSTNHFFYQRLDDVINNYMIAIKDVQPTGPYYFLGYSFGGIIAYEIANKLKLESKEIKFLGLIDSWANDFRLQHNEDSFKRVFKRANKNLPQQMIDLAWQREQLLLRYSLSITNQKMHLFKASILFTEYKKINSPCNGWDKYNKGEIIVHSIISNHDSIMNKKNLSYIVDIIGNEINNFTK